MLMGKERCKTLLTCFIEQLFPLSRRLGSLLLNVVRLISGQALNLQKKSCPFDIVTPSVIFFRPASSQLLSSMANRLPCILLKKSAEFQILDSYCMKLSVSRLLSHSLCLCNFEPPCSAWYSTIQKQRDKRRPLFIFKSAPLLRHHNPSLPPSGLTPPPSWSVSIFLEFVLARRAIKEHGLNDRRLGASWRICHEYKCNAHQPIHLSRNWTHSNQKELSLSWLELWDAWTHV